jgi:hypothetical protein
MVRLPVTVPANDTGDALPIFTALEESMALIVVVRCSLIVVCGQRLNTRLPEGNPLPLTPFISDTNERERLPTSSMLTIRTYVVRVRSRSWMTSGIPSFVYPHLNQNMPRMKQPFMPLMKLPPGPQPIYPPKRNSKTLFRKRRFKQLSKNGKFASKSPG